MKTSEPQDLIFNTGRAHSGTVTRHESNEFYAVILESIPAQIADVANCNFVGETKHCGAETLSEK